MSPRLCLPLILFASTAAFAQPVEITVSNLNVRSTANGSKVGRLQRGQPTVVRSTSNGWSRIDFGGRRAWVYSRFITPTSASVFEVTASRLNVRSGPSTRYRRIGQVSRGQRYVVLSTRGGWHRIQLDSRAGWVHGDFVERVGDADGMVGRLSGRSSSGGSAGPGGAEPAGGTVSAVSAPAAQEPPLRRGDRGPRVEALQRELNRLGAGLEVDGVFGARTEDALRAALAAGHELDTPTAPLTPPRRSSSGDTRGVPHDLIAAARRVLANNPGRFRSDVFVVVDFRRPSTQDRFFVVEGERVTAYFTAHGSGSDPGNTGRATRFSNVSRSHQSSVGVYRTAETYSGRHGYSLCLDGLSRTNSKARARAIVVHGASYVVEGSRAGRSWGASPSTTASAAG